MADLSKAVPVEPSKQGSYLHDQDRIPPGPEYTRLDIAARFSSLILGVIFGVAFVALAFQIRDSWGAHRDWVVPVTVPFFAIGGVALGHLLARGRWSEMLTGWVFAVLAVMLTLFALWRGEYVDGSDAFRDTLTIFAAIAMSLSIAAFAIAAILVEAKDPTRAPAPEM